MVIAWLLWFIASGGPNSVLEVGRSGRRMHDAHRDIRGRWKIQDSSKTATSNLDRELQLRPACKLGSSPK